MRDQYYIIDNDHPQERRDFDSKRMQEYLINHPVSELYHIEMPRIKILYNAQDGNVSLVDAENKGINSDFSNAYKMQRDQVLAAIRCCAKLKLLELLEEKRDDRITDLIKKSYEREGVVREHTSEIELDMTLTRIIKLGYPQRHGGTLYGLVYFMAGENKQKPTQVQLAVYTAFYDFGHSLALIKSINAALQFGELINKHLQVTHPSSLKPSHK